eukprot:scaffold61212_cov66-Phaeocystis_antarctica.AAC.7
MMPVRWQRTEPRCKLIHLKPAAASERWVHHLAGVTTACDLLDAQHDGRKRTRRQPHRAVVANRWRAALPQLKLICVARVIVEHPDLRQAERMGE